MVKRMQTIPSSSQVFANTSNVIPEVYSNSLESNSVIHEEFPMLMESLPDLDLYLLKLKENDEFKKLVSMLKKNENDWKSIMQLYSTKSSM
jgi:hypothetical protein